jgi:hypothetical protein
LEGPFVSADDIVAEDISVEELGKHLHEGGRPGRNGRSSKRQARS